MPTRLVGNGSAGHYVKMVHNGIEYGMMQLLAEAYDILKGVAGLSNEERTKKQSFWKSNRIRVMVSTNAFGMGIERQALLLYRISDIRYLFENDIRFLDQFKSVI